MGRGVLGLEFFFCVPTLCLSWPYSFSILNSHSPQGTVMGNGILLITLFLVKKERIFNSLLVVHRLSSFSALGEYAEINFSGSQAKN
jgi:hypothetical protein